MDNTPKEQLMDKIFNSIKEFERITGVVVKNIKINRHSVMEWGIVKRSEIIGYELELQ